MNPNQRPVGQTPSAPAAIAADRDVTGLALAVAVHLVAVVATIGRRGVWLDEAYTWGIVRQPTTSAFVEAVSASAGNNFLYLAIMRLWTAAGEGAVWMRVPSAVFGLVVVVATHRVALRLHGRPVARSAALLTASSVPLLYYSTEARAYSMLAALTVLLFLALLRALERDSRGAWVALGVVAAAAVGAHVIAVFWLPAIGLLAAGRLGLRRAFPRLVPLGIGGLGSLLVTALSESRDATFPPPLSPSVVARGIRFLLGDHGTLTRDGVGFFLMAVFAVLVAVGLVRSFRRGFEFESLFLVTWLVVPPVSITLVSLVEPLLWHRMLIGSLPALLILVSVVIRDARPTIGVLLLAVLVVGGLSRTWIISDEDLWEFEALDDFLQTETAAGDIVVFVDNWERAGLDYYAVTGAAHYRGAPPFGPLFEWGDARSNESALQARGDADVWIVDGADAAPVWRGEERRADEFGFDRITVPADLRPVGDYQLGRFRIRHYD